jgi:hypothetical protein
MPIKRKLFTVIFLIFALIGQGGLSVYASASMSAPEASSNDSSSQEQLEMGDHCKTNQMKHGELANQPMATSDECCSDCNCPVGGCSSQVMLDITMIPSLYSSTSFSYETLVSYASRSLSGLYRPPIFS